MSTEAIGPGGASAPALGAAARRGPIALRIARFALMPVLLGAALLALYLYVQAQDLDSIERRLLNAQVIRTTLFEHLKLTAASTGLVIVIAVPLGILVTRRATRAVTPFALAIGNIGQAVPSIGLLVLFAIQFDTGFKWAVFALVAYSVLPVLRNTMVGLQQVDPAVIEAARGMGLTRLGTLYRIELPLAVPVVLAGIRTALVINVASAALATYVGAGGLGILIDNGLRLDRMPVLLVGGVLTAALALTLDWLAGIVEVVVRPRGL